ncbi:MAG: hypothetical protein PHH93_08165 [Prolixibacteraceae bacterium]|nr:hypothetical protein [Prolixibacteraceae bacterium]
MTTRRDFIKKLSAAGIMSTIPAVTFPHINTQIPQDESGEQKIWALLLHLSVNMWKKYYNDLQFDEPVWNAALNKMAESGLNMIVMDLGDGIVYDSHPEIAVSNAWSTAKLKDELKKIRDMGIEPIPKLNFSTGHDAWLKDYGRMISSKKYYDVCRDLIEEVTYLYDNPRFFHLGMDEEKEQYQSPANYMIIRLNEVYWGDMYFLISEVFKNGSRPWIWQDFIRTHHDDFAKYMPKSVLQSNWFNRSAFSKPYNKSVQAYLDLEKLGYDQLPGGSNFYEGTDDCFISNVKFCTEHVADERLFGFIQSPWKYTTEENRAHLLSSIELAGEAKKWYEQNRKK